MDWKGLVFGGIAVGGLFFAKGVYEEWQDLRSMANLDEAKLHLRLKDEARKLLADKELTNRDPESGPFYLARVTVVGNQMNTHSVMTHENVPYEMIDRVALAATCTDPVMEALMKSGARWHYVFTEGTEAGPVIYDKNIATSDCVGLSSSGVVTGSTK